MKRTVGVVLVTFGTILTTCAFLAGGLLAMEALVRSMHDRLGNTLSRLVQQVGMDPGLVTLLPPALAAVGIALAGVGLHLRKPPRRSA